MADSDIAHLLRRAGFGAMPNELAIYSSLPYAAAVNRLVDYEAIPDDVDAAIGIPGYLGVTSTGAFSPNTVINDARQRWLFRMVHSQRPLQEKMTLFWHNHFATGFSKISGTYGSNEGTRLMAAKATEDPQGQLGQIEFLRQNALGTMTTILTGISQDPSMLVWLDNNINTRTRPQENFAREIMELFTLGVGYYTEPDVYAGARVFTGWSLTRTGTADPRKYTFVYNANNHETTAKTFSFPIYTDGNPTIPARTAAAGMQDGIDLINALVRNPNTARYLAKKLIKFFVTEGVEPNPAYIQRMADVYLANSFSIRELVRQILLSPEFLAPEARWARYSWPVEYVARALKETGWSGFSTNTAMSPLVSMGLQLFEPPDVAGWDLGTNWFSTGGMLNRMNFSSTLSTNQRVNLRNAARPYGTTPDSLLDYFLGRLTMPDLDATNRATLITYLRSGTGTPWTGSDTQLLTKAAGLVHIILGLPQYQAC
jgi:uncharacterized protein (DUF1800 family)